MYEIRRVLKGIKSLFMGPVDVRRRTIHEMVRIMAWRMGGHYVGDDYKFWLKDEGFANKFMELSPHNYFSMERKFALKEFARSVRDLPGCVAECGSYVGVAAWFIAREIQGVSFYLFDSFEGLSMPEGKDCSPEGVPQWKSGDMAVSEDVLKKNLRDFENIYVMKGWIPDRFAEVSDCQFKLVHVDVDLYQPTLDSLAFFYERMVPGGLIVMDDYGFENCPGAFAAANEYMANRPETIIQLPTGQGVIIRRGWIKSME
ncbi:MAG: class I SAM-dependent methyltransferase [Nitrospira sp.]|nr:class I SAM-dependent methyltransferase [Nitrospira sp.]